MCYVLNQWYDISCATLYILCVYCFILQYVSGNSGGKAVGAWC